MKNWRRLRNTFAVLLLMNIIILWHLLIPEETFWAGRIVGKVLLGVVIAVCFAVTEVLPCYEKGLSVRLQALAGGYELIVSTIWALIAEVVGYLSLFWGRNGLAHELSEGAVSSNILLTNGIVAFLVLLVHYLNGFWRTAFCSFQLGVGLRVLMLLFWWIPPVNIVLFVKWCRIVRRELIYEKNQYLLDKARVENAVCQTKYPIMMVHGIFFRDWHYMNYWGRIPKALKRNGAVVYYGKQQSALSVADSAEELKQEILHVLQESGAEKINIVAHSKGGLDARYAISMLGMEDVVASLTTVNTPHRGCKFADALLEGLPNFLVEFVAKRYNAAFHKLGDEAPDFLGGVRNLTAAYCEEFNKKVQDSPKVFYQSVMSKMRSVRSAGFPLNITYLLAKKYEGDNDGLVSVTSAPWGEFLGVLTAGRKGISHGDMIDLTHKNIKKFDVSEFYVQLFAGLKEKGF